MESAVKLRRTSPRWSANRDTYFSNTTTSWHNWGWLWKRSSGFFDISRGVSPPTTGGFSTTGRASTPACPIVRPCQRCPFVPPRQMTGIHPNHVASYSSAPSFTHQMRAHTTERSKVATVISLQTRRSTMKKPLISTTIQGVFARQRGGEVSHPLEPVSSDHSDSLCSESEGDQLEELGVLPNTQTWIHLMSSITNYITSDTVVIIC
ncbi:uncharacterized protein LOC112263249 [Oncorhynchus tshawytscha]|uniref:uncharacterized protein LOC112263249 n=1 Tax=Oncorhynchus tshawytscha TaxID=74940 RepID=UPI000D0A5154|nr:uncharacterized protein LOC112263249 [Oncorhynchus tshawytscha]